MFVILMNAKKNYLKLKDWPSVNWGLCIQRAIAEKVVRIECSNCFYLKSL